jgi:primosomal protein N' (replication factor Y)
MYIIDVIPAAKIPYDQPQVLSYFFSRSIEPGCIVEAPLRSKKVPMLVVRSVPVSTRKASLKSQSFSLKSVSGLVTEVPYFSPMHLSYLRRFSERWLMPLSVVVFAALPPQRVALSLALRKLYMNPVGVSPAVGASMGDARPATTVIRGSGTRVLCEAITNTLTQNGSVLLCAPHEESARAYHETLRAAGIESIRLERNSPIAQWKQALAEIAAGSPRVFIGGSFSIFLPIRNLSLVVVLDQDSPLQYHSFSLPYFYAPAACEDLAEMRNATLVFTSSMPTLDAYAGVAEGRYACVDDGWRSSYDPEIVNSAASTSPLGFSDAVLAKIRDAFAGGSKIFVFTHRRGYGRRLMCGSCGFTSHCTRCDIPLVYHVHGEKRSLMCHYCGTRQDPPSVCSQCKGYSFVLLGTGSEQVAARLVSEFGAAAVFRCDKDSIQDRAERDIIRSFLDHRSPAVLVGTERIFKYDRMLAGACGLAVGVAFDQIFSIPDYRTEESARRIMAKLFDISERCIIESRNPGRSFFKQIRNIDDSYQLDGTFRKRFQYPPYAHVVKLAYQNRQEAAVRDVVTRARDVIARAGFHVSSPVPAFAYHTRGVYTIELFCTLLDAGFPEKVREQFLALAKVIKALPPGFSVIVDPFELLS